MMAQAGLKQMMRSSGFKVGHLIVEFVTPGIGHILKAAGCDLVDFAPLADHKPIGEATLRFLADRASSLGAGMITTVVGSGSLITFPTLIALGYPPVLANVSLLACITLDPIAPRHPPVRVPET